MGNNAAKQQDVNLESLAGRFRGATSLQDRVLKEQKIRSWVQTNLPTVQERQALFYYMYRDGPRRLSIVVYEIELMMDLCQVPEFMMHFQVPLTPSVPVIGE